MNKKQNLEMTESGLQCDNPKCDWKDETIKFHNYKEWINKSCPKCSENVLTEEDYKNAEALRMSIDLINSLSEDKLKELTDLMNEESFSELKNDPMFSGAKGIENLETEKEVIVTFSSHKQIKVEEIKKVN